MSWSTQGSGGLLKPGSSAATVLLTMLPEAQRGVLRRCSSQRSFDEALYDAVLRPPDGPALADLLRAGQLEPAPREPDRHRLLPELRRVAFEEWWTRAGLVPGEPPVPTPLRTLAAAAARHHADHERPLDVLDQLLLYDLPAAQECFIRMYDEADQRFDLTGCQAILGVLDSPYRFPLLDASLLALRHDRSCYLAARTMWRAEYHRTERYVSRRHLEVPLDELLTGAGKAVQLTAPMGMGKTMQLDWFIARRCVPAPDRIACARVDFTALDAVTVCRHPWLLLVEIAAQLDPQLVSAPFQDLLTSNGPYRALLARDAERRASVEQPAAAAGVDAADVYTRFVDALTDTPSGRPVVVVFDALEELVFRIGGEPTEFARLLGRLHDNTEALRLVLASEVDLREQLPVLGGALPRLRTVPIEPLDEHERGRFFGEARGRGGAISVAELGAPTRDAAGSTPKDIEDSLADAYVVSKIITQIDDDRVRWLVRYGVVPRQLTFGFVAEVLAPFLVQSMQGDPSVDDPGAHPSCPTDLWRPVQLPLTEAALEEIWGRLVDHADVSSWIQLAENGAQALTFHPDVAVPLRRLLRAHPVFAELHLAAARYYQTLADERPAEWPALTCEAVYHRFQTDPVAGVEAWRRALGEARTRGGAQWVLTLAGELSSRDYVDEHGMPRPGLPLQTLAEAHVERGRAAAELAPEHPVESVVFPLWADAQNALDAARALVRAAPDVVLPEPATTLLTARLLIAQGQPERAETLLRTLDEMQPFEESVDVERALGDALRSLGRQEAKTHYRRSFELARERGDVARARRAAFSLAHERLDQGRADEALHWLGKVATVSLDPDDAEVATLLQVRALANSGLPVQADRVATAFLSQQGASPPILAARGSLLAQSGRPEEALLACTEALDRLHADSAPSAALTAKILAVRGGASARLLDFDDALDDLVRAAARSRDLRDIDAAVASAAAAAMLQMTGLGDVRGAAQAVEEADRAQAEPGRPGWAAAVVAAARLLDRSGEAAAAQDRIDSAWPQLARRGGTPPVWITTAIGGLCLAPSPSTAGCLRVLAEQLASITPPAGRLALLDGLEEAPELPADLRDRAEPLVDLARAGLSSAMGPAPEPSEEALLQLAAGQVFRMTGRHQEARDALDRAVQLRGDDFLWWRWLRARQQMAPARADEPQPPEELKGGNSHPVLGAAYLMTLCEYRRSLDGPERAADRLERADRLLPRSGRPHQWTARLQELQAGLARERGAATPARNSASGAVRIWGSLGDDERQESLGTDYQLGQQWVDPGAECVELRLKRVVRPGPDRVDAPFARVVARRPDGDERTGYYPLSQFGDSATGALGERLRAMVKHFVERWQGWPVEAAEVFPPWSRQLLAEASADRRLDVRLVVADRDMAALPWELLRLPEADADSLGQLPGVATVYRSPAAHERDENKVLALQTVLQRLGLLSGVPDGLMGPATEEAIRRFKAGRTDAGNGTDVDGALGRPIWGSLRAALGPRRRPVRVLAVRPNLDRELHRRRGAGASGIDLARLYQRQGAEVSALDDPSTERLHTYGDLMRDTRPDVIHVAAPVTLSSGATLLDFGDAAARGLVPGRPPTDRLPVTALAKFVATVAQGSYGPVVVIDVPRPRTRSEAVRALIVRNSFAHQLLGLGHVVGVIATGLVSPAGQDAFYDLLIGGLSAGDDPAAVARRIQTAELPDATFGEVLPFRATALFLQRQPYTLLPLGLS